MRANLSNDVDNDADGDDDDDYDDGDDDEEEGVRMRMRMIFIGATCGFFFLRVQLCLSKVLPPENYFGLSICHCNTQEGCNAAQVARLLIKGSTAHQVLGVDVDRSIVEALPLYSNHGPLSAPRV